MEENNKLVLAENIETAENTPHAEETASPVPHPIKKLPLTHSLPAKVAAFILTIIAAAVACVSIAVCAMLVTSNHQVYTVPKDEMKKIMYENEACNNAGNVLNFFRDADIDSPAESAYSFVDMRNVASMTIEFSSDQSFRNWSYTSPVKQPGDMKFTFMFYDFGDGFVERYSSVVLGAKSSAKVTVVLAKNFTSSDRYSMDSMILDVLYALRYVIFVIAVITVIMAIAGFIFLMSASGRHQTSDKPEASFGTKIPFDILVAGTVLLFGLLPSLIFHNIERDSAENIIIGFFMIALLAAGLGLCMSFATRVKLGGWWKNTVIYMIVHGIWNGIKGLFKLFFKMPLVWKTSLIAAFIFLLDLIFVGFADDPEKVIYIFIRSVLLFPALIYLALMLRKLLNGSKAMAEGDLEKQVSTKGMFGDFRKAANNLNSIGKGMSLAVEERTKSDRMKTELITNVSHDIKTPLTSIINYSDLISKEPAGSEKIGEYAEVLHRQSEKLKRLIDDLVETSKATTGNLEVILAPCSVNEMLSQAEGEYEQRMKDAGLTLVSVIPEKAVSIMADGRRLWRVFDNLMSNACKYALSGTRVYMSLEEQGKEAVITFKNTSREALNISTDELMERFVRGDRSRNSGTEGNGLGLAIAKSLTELQNGKLELFIDGDLFKAELRFPLI